MCTCSGCTESWTSQYVYDSDGPVALCAKRASQLLTQHGVIHPEDRADALNDAILGNRGDRWDMAKLLNWLGY